MNNYPKWEDFLSADIKDWHDTNIGGIFLHRQEKNRPELPLLSVTGGGGVVDRDTLERRDTSNADKSKYLKVSTGDIVYNTMRMWQGVSGSAHKDGLVSPAYTVLEPKESIIPLFAKYLVKEERLVQVFHRNSQGLVDDTLNLKFANLSPIKVKIPPLPEQKKIASILTSVDEVIENTQKQINKLQDLKKATMNELLTKGIGHTEFKDSELGQIPKSWEVKTIDDVIKFTGGAQPPRSSFIFAPKEGYVRLLQIRDYKSDRFATYIPEKLSRRNCNEDDVLIGRYGPPIFQILRGKAGSYNVALIKSEPRNGSLLKGYMYHFLTRSDLFHLIDSLSQRTSGQTGIDLDALKSFGFPFPPIEEQHRILEILDHMDAANKRLLNKLSQTQSLKKSLMKDLLTGKVRVTVN